MTNDEMRIAIAESLGFSGFCIRPISMIHSGRVMWDEKAQTHIPLPDYLNDANAIDDAIRQLPEDKQHKYLYFLGEVLYIKLLEAKVKNPFVREWDKHIAMPGEKSEAYLRTIGK